MEVQIWRGWEVSRNGVHKVKSPKISIKIIFENIRKTSEWILGRPTPQMVPEVSLSLSQDGT